MGGDGHGMPCPYEVRSGFLESFMAGPFVPQGKLKVRDLNKRRTGTSLLGEDYGWVSQWM